MKPSYRESGSNQESFFINHQEQPGFWESVPLLQRGAVYLLDVPVMNKDECIESRVQHWLDKYFQGDVGHICQRDCEDFAEHDPDLCSHEPAMVLAIANTIATRRHSN